MFLYLFTALSHEQLISWTPEFGDRIVTIEKRFAMNPFRIFREGARGLKVLVHITGQY
jgi:hypothetical protein